MFGHNLWLKVPLLFAVVGHASLFEALTRREPPWWEVGLVVTIGSIVTPLLGEWLAEDAATPRWRRLGWSLAAGGALVHLLLDAACLALPWIAASWRAGLAGALVGALVMAFLLHRYIGALRDPDAHPPPPWAPSGSRWPARAWRGAALLGGTAIMVMLIGLGFVAAALWVLVARPEVRGEGKLWLSLLFFGACAIIGLFMGLERRALILGRPSPIRPSWRRGSRRTTYVVTADGLLRVDRRGATLYPWSAITAVWGGTSFHNPTICVALAPDGSPRRIGDDTRWQTAEGRLRATNRALFGVDLMLFAVQTEDGPGPLLAQLSEALTDLDRTALPSVEQEIARLRMRNTHPAV